MYVLVFRRSDVYNNKYPQQVMIQKNKQINENLMISMGSSSTLNKRCDEKIYYYTCSYSTCSIGNEIMRMTHDMNERPVTLNM